MKRFNNISCRLLIYGVIFIGSFLDNQCLASNLDSLTDYNKYDLGVSLFSVRFNNPNYSQSTLWIDVWPRFFNALQFRKHFDQQNSLRIALDYHKLKFTDYVSEDFYDIIEESEYEEQSIGMSIGYQNTFKRTKKISIYFLADLLERYTEYTQRGQHFNANIPLIDNNREGNVQEFGISLGLGLQLDVSAKLGLNLEISYDAVQSKITSSKINENKIMFFEVIHPINRFVLSYRI